MNKIIVRTNVSFEESKKVSGNALYFYDVLNSRTFEPMHTKFGIARQKTVYDRIRSHATPCPLGTGHIIIFKTEQECVRAENLLKANLARLSWNGSVRECCFESKDELLALMFKLMK